MRTRLHRNVSEPYTKNLRRLQEVHRTLSESASSYHSAADDMTKTSRVARRPSLKRPDWNPNDSGSSKKSVTWIDKEIPGRSISEFHLITPRSFRMQQCRDQALPSSGGGGGAGSQAQSRVSLHVNQQLQYYYYHQRAGKSSACSTCMSSLRAFWWGV
mmetsp:Transcript_1517/g.5678  ORF Transcript_1517/g.5678 Transcript_1517/m.5678 type:complete len:158 (-) Transcript_1517:109-582(-)